MKTLRYILFSAIFLAIGWLIWTNYSDVSHVVNQYVDNSDILTFEAKYTPEKIMKDHEKELLRDKNYTYKAPVIKFYPFALLNVKYTQTDKKTKESQLLWNLNDGEIVLNTETWEKTHGFQDCLNANTNSSEFRIINALARKNGTMSLEEIQKDLHLDEETLAPWIESARQKQLIIQRGNQLQLHFENPKIAITPESKISQWIVNKPSSQAIKTSSKYSSSQIEKIAKAAFGSDFTIREFKNVYLPVYSLEVQNPDGSTFTTSWNAITGEKI